MTSTERIVKHIDFLDGLRAIAALFVLFSHTWYQIWPAVLPPYGYGNRPTGLILMLTSWLYYGHFAVIVFIVLSGFCLMLPVIKNNGILRGGTLQFFKRRAKRILPPYYFALLFSLLLIWFFIGLKTGSQWDISLPVTQEGLLSHLSITQDFVTSTQINYVFWSIAVEAQLYCFFPLLVLGWRRFGGVKTTLGAGLIIYTTILLLEITQSKDIPPQFVGLCFYFVLGMLAATIVFSPEKFWYIMRQYFPWRFTVVGCVLAIIFFCYLWGFDKAEKIFSLLDTLCALGTLSLLVDASNSENNTIRKIISSKFLVFLGTFTYSLYLIHAPLLQLIWQYIVHPLNFGKGTEFVLLLLIGTPLILIVSYIFFFYCERPFLNIRRITA
ncbi:MAG: acyltransferase family protein [Nostoc sp. ChiQUE02]|uniref:acyltransferase family protein n=1 Tax=Nostoc sp. ChiQUE02 TaxID=3075377 RepID=UPI002AD3F804|nr:acyltransferase [Nostoc sp. ChiQUE02]MDZ8231413.1 acyltransferase [Nostoc sp. ChiQUE02]